MANLIPLIVNAGAAQIQELSNSDNLIVQGNILAGGYYYANGQPFVGGGGAVYVTSNVTAVVAGQALTFNVDLSNTTYPGGVFTLVQNSGPTPPPGNLTMTDTWGSGSTSKNQYSDFANGVVDTQTISLTLALANATFSVQVSDTITVGNSTITGSNLLSLGIAGNGGTYIIPSSSFANTVQTANSSAVSASLTTTGGVVTATGTTLTTVAPVPFTVATISGTFPDTTVTPETVNQAFNWVASGVSGTITSGVVSLSGSQTANLSTTGETSGTSQVYDSTVGPFNLSATYTGTGTNGAGGRSVTITGNVPVATTFAALYWKTTTSNANPNFTTGDNNLGIPYAPDTGQGANAGPPTTNYLWMAIPTAGPGPVPPVFKFDFPPFIGVVTDPVETYSNVSIGGITYNAYGFTDFSGNAFIYTASA